MRGGVEEGAEAFSHHKGAALFSIQDFLKKGRRPSSFGINSLKQNSARQAHVLSSLFF